jgi:hypothetical protein
MKKIPIEFRKSGYDLKMKAFNNKSYLKKLISKEITQLIGIDPADGFNYSNTVKEFFSLLEQQKKEVNSLGLVGEKLAELLQIDVTKLKELQSEYIKVSYAILPSIEEFTLYAETEKEITKYNDCIALIKAIQTAKIHLDVLGDYNHFKIYKAFIPMLTFDGELQKIVPNNEFIKS